MLEADQRAVRCAAVREMMEQAPSRRKTRWRMSGKLIGPVQSASAGENAVTARGQLVFRRFNDFPDAWRVADVSTDAGKVLKVTVRLFRDTEPKVR